MRISIDPCPVAARVACAAGIVLATAIGTAAGQTRGGQAPAGQPPARGAAPATPAANARRFTLIGCVSRDGTPADQRFLITDPRGDKPTVYKLEGDKTELNFHVGHTIEVRGPLTTPAAGGRGSNASALTMTVESITYVSRTCTAK